MGRSLLGIDDLDRAEIEQIVLDGGEHGIDIGALRKMLAEMRDWLEEKQYQSVSEFKGCMSQENCPQPAAFERGNYMKALTSFTGKPI